MKTTKYKIGNWTEEDSCLWCGYPMYVGDIMIHHDDRPYCSKKCIEEDGRFMAVEEKEDIA